MLTAAKRRLLASLLLGWVLALVGCVRGPDAETAWRDLRAHLDSRFQEGLFDVRDFHRVGSANYRDVERGVSGTYIYYDAELVFQRDYKLADWQGLNLGTLSYVLGAAEAGVSGFQPEGNARGDVLTVHGRIPYRDQDGQWVAFADESLQPDAIEPAAQRVRGPGPDAVLADARPLVERSPEVDDGGVDAIIITELQRAVERIDLRRARLKGQTALATGPVQGTYYGFGAAVARFALSQKMPLVAYPSKGSVDNAGLLQSGAVEFGLVQSDVAQLLYEGRSAAGYFPNRNLRTVASLWPEAVHIVTLEGTGIRSIDDLAGRRVAIGLRGSGSRVNAVLLGQVAQLTEEQMPVIVEASTHQAVRDLEKGRIDAFVLTQAVPAPSLQNLASRRRDVRFLSIPPRLIEQLAALHSAYYPMHVAARTYPHQTQPFVTLGLSAALMTSKNVPDEKVEAMLRGLLNNSGRLARDYYRAGFITRETMRLGIAVPLHAAAERIHNQYEAAAPGGRSPDTAQGVGVPR